MDQKIFSAVVLGVVAALGVLIATSSDQNARAGCLWDRDTLRVEAAGAPGVAEVLTGRFDRFPPLYYEMRLKRVAKTLESEPGNLSLYDDAAVACDRLGRTDEAIAWMARKRTQLDHVKDFEHEYRYLANLGTFHAHRWIRNGANGTQLHDLQLAQALVTRAIELNPDAHFGRERYQLLAIDWLIATRDGSELVAIESSFSPSLFDADQNLRPASKMIGLGGNHLLHSGYEDAVEGLTGLMTLGNAWQSVDVTYALQLALADRGDGNLAHLAELRLRRLLATGASSLHPEVSPDADTRARTSAVIPAQHTLEIEEYYRQAVKEAESWASSREAYALERLRDGRHPDTDAQFWADWKPMSSPPAIPGRMGSGSMLAIAIGIVLIAGGVIGAAGIAMLRRSRSRIDATKVPA